MGARVHFIFKEDETAVGEPASPSVVLYSHWGADTWEVDLACALSVAEPRWDDTSYATRIVISNLIGEQWKSEIGFGIYATMEIPDTWGDPCVVIDFANKTVDGVAFDTFVKYGLAKGEYQDA
jgi:hypothetical protein